MKDFVGKIVGTKRWVYLAVGDVPPQVPEDTMPGVVHSSVSWAGNLLPVITGTAVQITSDDLDVLMRRLGMKS